MGELRGSLRQLPAAALMARIEIHGRTGVLSLEHGTDTATLSYEGGSLTRAELSDGRAGRDVVRAVRSWADGNFLVRLEPRNAPPGGPPAAAGEAGPPGAWRVELHRALALLNLAVSYAAASDHPSGLPAEEVAERLRHQLEEEHPGLGLFRVAPSATVTLRPGIDPSDESLDGIHDAVRRWLEALFDDFARQRPDDFSRRVLARFTASIYEEPTHGDKP